MTTKGSREENENKILAHASGTPARKIFRSGKEMVHDERGNKHKTERNAKSSRRYKRCMNGIQFAIVLIE